MLEITDGVNIAQIWFKQIKKIFEDLKACICTSYQY